MPDTRSRAAAVIARLLLDGFVGTFLADLAASTEPSLADAKAAIAGPPKAVSPTAAGSVVKACVLATPAAVHDEL